MAGYGYRRLVLSAALLAGACSDGSAVSDLPTADVSRVLVYFPVGQGARGLVRGRGRAGTFPAGEVGFAVIRTFPSEFNEVVVPVAADGGFDFQLRAGGRETLEIAPALAADGAERGPGAFIEVPPTPLPTSDQICCRNGDLGTCLTRSEAELRTGLDIAGGERDSPACPDAPAPKFACSDDRACLIFERRRYPIDSSVFELSAPGPGRRISVVATPSPELPLIPNGLVLMENRGLSGLGEEAQVDRYSLIAEPDGGFRFNNIFARGDDELVVEILDLNDFRTPTLSLFVPDPPAVSAHLVEAWPVSDLNNGAGAIIGLRFFFVGEDGRGLCPDAPALDPAYCFGGGIEAANVRVLNASIDGVSVQLCPAIRPGEDPWANCSDPGGGVERLTLDTPRRGVDGDVRADSQFIAVLVDLSQMAPPARQPYFAGLADYARYLPQNSGVSWVFIGGDEADTDFLPPEDAATHILEVEARATLSGPNDLFVGMTEPGALARALDRVERAAGAAPQGRVLITSSTPAELPDTSSGGPFETLIGRVQSDGSSPGVPVDIVVIGDDGQPTPTGETQDELLATLSQFSGRPGRRGRVFSESDFSLNVFDQRRLLRDARGWASGGHLLLYELLPVTVDGLSQIGKLGNLEVDVEVSLPGVAPLPARYEGPLEFQRVTAD